MKRQLGISIVVMMFTSGCSHHLFIPSNRFDFPETHGQWLWGRAQVRYQGTTRIEHVPSFADPSPRLNDPLLTEDKLVLNDLALAADTGIVKNLDLLLKIPIAPSPTLLGVKYQFKGSSYDKRKKGDVPIAATLAGGLNRQEAEVESRGIRAKFRTDSWAVDGALIIGYRGEKDLLIYGGPFYSYYSSKGDFTNTASSQNYSFAGEGRQMGANAGVSYSFLNSWNAAVEFAVIDLAWSYSKSFATTHFGVALTREF